MTTDNTQTQPEVWPCTIIGADFQADTVTLKMTSSDYLVSAGKYWLCTTDPQPGIAPPTREKLETLIAGLLSLTYHTTRCWSAWQTNTMTEDDFYPADESETPGEIANAVLALYAHPQPGIAPKWVMLTDADIYEMYVEPISDSEMIAFARRIQAAFIAKQGGAA